MLRGPLKGGSPGESTKPSFVKEFVTETDPEIVSTNFTSKDSRSGGWVWVWGGVRWDGVSSRIKEGKHEAKHKFVCFEHKKFRAGHNN